MTSSQSDTIYTALIGDLVNSRESEDRADVQREVTRKIDELNASLGDSLAARLRLTAGDEIQGLLSSPSDLVGIVQSIRDHLFGAPTDGARPLEQLVAFGAGRGPLTTGPLSGSAHPDVALLDGPCFHRARSALARAQKRRSWTAFEGFGEFDLVLDSLFGLMGAVRDHWTPRQSRYTVLARVHGLQKTVAEELGINPSVVSEGLKAARFEEILRGEESARALLSSFASK